MSASRSRWRAIALRIRALVFALAVVLGPTGCRGYGQWDMRTLLDHKAVRVVEVDFKVGSKTPRHHHDDSFIYTLSAARVRITGSDGKPVDLELKANQALWRDAEIRTLENMGGTDHGGVSRGGDEASSLTRRHGQIANHRR